MRTKEWAQKLAAGNLGITYDQYKTYLSNSQKHCWKCNKWKLINNFCKDNSRWDGVSRICNSCSHSPDPYASLRGRTSTFKGKKHTAEAKNKISAAANIRRNNGYTSPRKGIPRTIEERAKISAGVRKVALRGKDCPAYKDGKAVERRGARFSIEYKRWRYDIFLRDKFTCQKCGDDKGGNLIAHHIKPFADYPELRHAADNGITLCEDCHKREHYNQWDFKIKAHLSSKI